MSKPTLNARVIAHLGDDGAPHVIHRRFPNYLAGDVAIACKEYFDRAGADLLRFTGDPAKLFEPEAEAVASADSPVLEHLDVGTGRSRQGLREGLALFRRDGVPLIAYCRWKETGALPYRVSVLARDLSEAERMLEDLGAFAEQHRAITSPLFERVTASLNTRLRTHLGDGPTPSVLVHVFPEYQIANISIQVKSFFDDLGADFTGLGAGSGYDFGEIDEKRMHAVLKPASVDAMGSFEGYDPTAPTFEQIAVGDGSNRVGLRNGIVLFRFDDVPMLACCSRSARSHDEYRLSIVSRDVGAAERLFDSFCAYERANSIFRGRLIRPKIDFQDRVREAEILRFSDVAWEDVILPVHVRHRIQRDMLEYIAAADRLSANGIEPRRCFLFYGPPGTGKTFVCRLLATQLRGFTSVLVTGDNLRRPEAACALARSLAPALLFFEDVDLVARDRDGNPFPTALGGLLNELDGLAAGERVYVVFTTNRLEVLEPALAQRPGRVDMIVGFPLPEPALRRELVKLYVGRAELFDTDIDWIVEQTDGVTPAFLREFMKEAVFTAISTGAVRQGGLVVLARDHLVATFERFAAIRREHNADRLLGFRA